VLVDLLQRAATTTVSFSLPFLKTCPIYSSDMTGLLQEAAVAATTGHKRPTAASDEVKLPFYLL